MSVEALSWAFKVKLPATLKVVLLHFADRANEDHECHPSHRDGTTRTGLDERTLRRSVQRLIELGLILAEPRVSQHGRHTSNQYRLCVDGGRVAQVGTRPGRVGHTPTMGGTRPTLEPSSEPSERNNPHPTRAKTRLEGGSLSRREARVHLPDDWLPTPETRAVAQEHGIHERLGEFLRRFGDYYGPDGEGAERRLTPAGWQLKAQEWLRRERTASGEAPQGQDRPARARTGRVARGNKKTQDQPLGPEELPSTSFEEHIGAWYAAKVAEDSDAAFANADDFLTLARLVVDEETWRGDCERFFAPFVERLGKHFDNHSMVADAVAFAQRARQVGRSIAFFAGVWDATSARLWPDRDGDYGWEYRRPSR